jgi:hypothetical protein
MTGLARAGPEAAPLAQVYPLTAQHVAEHSLGLPCFQ